MYIITISASCFCDSCSEIMICFMFFQVFAVGGAEPAADPEV